MEAWTDLYQELADKIKDKLTDIQWVDLWHEQVSYLTEELPFPTPAVFIAFNTNNCDDKGLLIQDVETQIDFYLYYETFSDSYQGSYNKASAIDFLKTLTKIHTLFHGQSGNNFGTMRRVDMRREESGGAGNLYRISFATVIEDGSAIVEFNKKEVNEVVIKNEQGEREPVTDEQPLYTTPTS